MEEDQIRAILLVTMTCHKQKKHRTPPNISREGSDEAMLQRTGFHWLRMDLPRKNTDRKLKNHDSVT
jgi:hypothetical protein